MLTHYEQTIDQKDRTEKNLTRALDLLHQKSTASRHYYEWRLVHIEQRRQQYSFSLAKRFYEDKIKRVRGVWEKIDEECLRLESDDPLEDNDRDWLEETIRTRLREESERRPSRIGQRIWSEIQTTGITIVQCERRDRSIESGEGRSGWEREESVHARCLCLKYGSDVGATEESERMWDNAILYRRAKASLRTSWVNDMSSGTWFVFLWLM